MSRLTDTLTRAELSALDDAVTALGRDAIATQSLSRNDEASAAQRRFRDRLGEILEPYLARLSGALEPGEVSGGPAALLDECRRTVREYGDQYRCFGGEWGGAMRGRCMALAERIDRAIESSPETHEPESLNLGDPHTVFRLMHDGEVARPTLPRLVQLYGFEELRMHLASIGPPMEIADTLRSRAGWGRRTGQDSLGTSILMGRIADQLSIESERYGDARLPTHDTPDLRITVELRPSRTSTRLQSGPGISPAVALELMREAISDLEAQVAEGEEAHRSDV